MIGAQSGQWYVYERGQWIEAKPPSQMERKAICIACGFENDLEAEILRPLRQPAGRGRARRARRGRRRRAFRLRAKRPPASAAGEIVVRSLDLRSFFWFFGVFGLFAGILVGLLAGVTGLFAGFVDRLPAFFVEHQGDLLGGISCSVVGGVLGFGVGGAAGLLLAVVSNGILSLVGGLRFRRS